MKILMAEGMLRFLVEEAGTKDLLKILKLKMHMEGVKFKEVVMGVVEMMLEK